MIVCNKINCLCFTAGADENVSIYTNQFISQRMQIDIEKKEIHTRAVLTIARELKLPKLP